MGYVRPSYVVISTDFNGSGGVSDFPADPVSLAGLNAYIEEQKGLGWICIRKDFRVASTGSPNTYRSVVYVNTFLQFEQDVSLNRA